MTLGQRERFQRGKVGDSRCIVEGGVIQPGYASNGKLLKPWQHAEDLPQDAGLYLYFVELNRGELLPVALEQRL
jgi:hypothetical protein